MTADLKSYPTYQESGIPWLERIPSHWEIKPGFAAYRQKQQKNIGMVERRVLSLSYGRIVIKPGEKLHGLVPASFETYQIVNPGDIIIRSTDLQNDWNSLRVGLVRDRGIITSAYLCLNMTGPLLAEYAYQQLHAYDLMKIFYGMGSGLRQNLDFSDLKRMPVLVPPREEQTAIVRYLDHVDRRIRRYIQAKRRLIALLNEQKQAIIHQAVTRGLDPNASLKPSGVAWLGDIPAHWEVAPLKSVCFIQSGITLGKNYLSENLIEHPYLRVANVQAGRLDLSTVKKIRLPETDAKRSLLYPGDVLMTEGGDPDKLGRGCVWEGEISPCLHQNHVFAVRPFRHKLLPHFLAALLGASYAKNYFMQTAKQTTNLASTNKTTIGQFRVLLPSIAEQNDILQQLELYLKPLNEAITRTEREIDLIREYRTRLIADVVTGKLDVRGAAASLPDEPGEPEAFDDAGTLADDEEELAQDFDAEPAEAG